MPAEYEPGVPLLPKLAPGALVSPGSNTCSRVANQF